jgi:hypothetical protein
MAFSGNKDIRNMLSYFEPQVLEHKIITQIVPFLPG